MENIHIYNENIEPDLHFYVYDLNESEYSELNDLYEAFKWLVSDSRDALLSKIKRQDVCFDYNTHTREAKLSVKYADGNLHNHYFDVIVRPQRSLHLSINYQFDGVFDKDYKSVRSFAELLMAYLWELGYDADICNCDMGLIIDVRYYNITKAFVDIIRAAIELEQPLEWFYDMRPQYDFPNTYFTLCQILPKLREEADNNRWKDVKPGNFNLHIKKDYNMIRLDYVEDGLYQMIFKLGCEKNSFCVSADDRCIDCSYDFILLSTNEEVCKYYENQNREFCKTANAILSILCNWKALHFHSEDSVYITVERQIAFQRFCLMLDVLLSLKNEFTASERLITSGMLQLKSQVEVLLGSKCELTIDDEDLKIFSHGQFIDYHIYDRFNELDMDMINDVETPF